MLQEERREEGDVNVAIAFVDRCFVGFLMLLLFALGVVLRVLNIDDVTEKESMQLWLLKGVLVLSRRPKEEKLSSFS
ncbi:unnamed protein product [Bathycoccus prasinos]